MTRRLLNLVTALALLACAVVFAAGAVAMVASYREPWFRTWSSGHSGDPINELAVVADQGLVAVQWRRTFYRPITRRDMPRVVLGGVAFDCYRMDDKVRYRVIATRRALLCVAAAFALPTALIPVRWHRRAARRRRSAAGLCLSCGYDLTGNVSGVCPECGERLEGRHGRAWGAGTLVGAVILLVRNALGAAVWAW